MTASDPIYIVVPMNNTTSALTIDEALAAQEAAAEIYAEFGSSWLPGGGRSDEVSAAWAQGIGR